VRAGQKARGWPHRRRPAQPCLTIYLRARARREEHNHGIKEGRPRGRSNAPIRVGVGEGPSPNAHAGRSRTAQLEGTASIYSRRAGSSRALSARIVLLRHATSWFLIVSNTRLSALLRPIAAGQRRLLSDAPAQLLSSANSILKVSRCARFLVLISGRHRRMPGRRTAAHALALTSPPRGWPQFRRTSQVEPTKATTAKLLPAGACHVPDSHVAARSSIDTAMDVAAGTSWLLQFLHAIGLLTARRYSSWTLLVRANRGNGISYTSGVCSVVPLFDRPPRTAVRRRGARLSSSSRIVPGCVLGYSSTHSSAYPPPVVRRILVICRLVHSSRATAESRKHGTTDLSAPSRVLRTTRRPRTDRAPR